MATLFDLKGEVAVVIGGTGALGGAMADGFGAHGAKVAVLGRSAERGGARVDAIKAAGGEAAFFSCDASSAESIKTAMAELEAALGPTTILVNAAGGNDPQATVTPDNPFETMPVRCCCCCCCCCWWWWWWWW